MNKSGSKKNGKREILTFFLDNNVYGIWLDTIAEVTQMPEAAISKVPLTTAALLGLTSIRGRVVALLDIHAVLALTPASEYSQMTVVLFNYKNDIIGILIDQLGEVLPASSGVLTDQTVADSAVSATVWSAMFTVDGKIIPLLSIAGIMQTAFTLQH